jgi:ribosomal protein S18 acetylase RimI-like enzyme
MEVLELTWDDVESVVVLWAEVGLSRPWNDPSADFQRANEGLTSAVLGMKEGSEIVGTVMVGHDGHRGWVYYLAVRESHRRAGLGSQLMRAAEEWLCENGAVKIQLMVRSGNDVAINFYEHLRFETNDVLVLSKWLAREA